MLDSWEFSSKVPHDGLVGIFKVSNVDQLGICLLTYPMMDWWVFVVIPTMVSWECCTGRMIHGHRIFVEGNGLKKKS